MGELLLFAAWPDLCSKKTHPELFDKKKKKNNNNNHNNNNNDDNDDNDNDNKNNNDNNNNNNNNNPGNQLSANIPENVNALLLQQRRGIMICSSCCARERREKPMGVMMFHVLSHHNGRKMENYFTSSDPHHDISTQPR